MPTKDSPDALAGQRFQAAPRFIPGIHSQRVSQKQITSTWTAQGADDVVTARSQLYIDDLPDCGSFSTKRRRLSVSLDIEEEPVPSNVVATGHQPQGCDTAWLPIEHPEHTTTPRIQHRASLIPAFKFQTDERMAVPKDSDVGRSSPIRQHPGYISGGLASEAQAWLSMARGADRPNCDHSASLSQIVVKQVVHGETLSILRGHGDQKISSSFHGQFNCALLTQGCYSAELAIMQSKHSFSMVSSQFQISLRMDNAWLVVYRLRLA